MTCLEKCQHSVLAGILALVLTAGMAQAQSEEDPSRPTTTNNNSGGGGFLDNLLSPFNSGTKTNVTNGQQGPSIDDARSEAYDGPKARIAVARFTDKTRKGWYSRSIGDGMADQLVTALFNSNKFIVLERQTLGDVLQEQDLGASGRVRKDTAARIGEIEGAELLVTAAVTEFEGAASGGRTSGVGGTSGGLLKDVGRLIGSATAAFKRAHIAIDLRIVDTNTSRIVAATSVEGEATDVDMSAALFGASGSGGLGGSLGIWKNTPTEKALRIVIARAVEFIGSRTPQRFYRFGPGGSKPAAVSRTTNTNTAPAQKAPNYQSGMTARVTSNSLNMRSGPSTGNPVVGSLGRGTPLLILATSGKWVQVQSDTGVSGWVASWLTTPDPGISAEIFDEEPQPAAAVQTTATQPKAQSSGAGTSDVAGRLKRLKTLHEQGLISTEDYEAKKQKIIDDL